MRITVVSPAPSDIDSTRQHVVVDAEAPGVLGDERHADILGEPHGHQVLRLLDAVAQGVRAVGLPS